MELNLLVIRTVNPEALKEQYKILGFRFDYHRHGAGPYHYTSKLDDLVFEIYPLTKSMSRADSSLRLGFAFDNLESIISKIENTNWIVLSWITESEWGRTALIQDLDGRKIELKQKEGLS